MMTTLVAVAKDGARTFRTQELLSRTATGRQWGNKIDEKRRGDIIENDAWEGPVEPGEKGQYSRCKWRIGSVTVPPLPRLNRGEAAPRAPA